MLCDLAGTLHNKEAYLSFQHQVDAVGAQAFRDRARRLDLLLPADDRRIGQAIR